MSFDEFEGTVISQLEFKNKRGDSSSAFKSNFQTKVPKVEPNYQIEQTQNNYHQKRQYAKLV